MEIQDSWLKNYKGFQDGDSRALNQGRALLSPGPHVAAQFAHLPKAALSLELCQVVGGRRVSAEESSGGLLAARGAAGHQRTPHEALHLRNSLAPQL